MPIPLGSGSSVIIVGDDYDPPNGGPATIGPVQTLRRVQFTVSQYSVFAQLAAEVDIAGQPIYDQTEVPYPPGTWTIDQCSGIRFRNAVAGLSAILNATGYLEGDPLPLAINQGAKGFLGSLGQILDAPTQTIFSATGTSQYDTPAGCTGILIEIWGGGGGGGGVAAPAAGQAAGGGGAGGGGYAAIIVPIPLIGFENVGLTRFIYRITSFNITIGAGGTGGVGNAQGNNGADSIVQALMGGLTPVLERAIGGGGGFGSPVVAVFPSVTASGGIGGSFSVYGGGNPISPGQITGYGLQGMQGQNGWVVIAAGRENPIAGGGQAAKGSAGAYGTRTMGAVTGANGTSPGGGGGGALSISGGGARNGGNGGDGLAVITEFYGS